MTVIPAHSVHSHSVTGETANVIQVIYMNTIECMKDDKEKRSIKPFCLELHLNTG